MGREQFWSHQVAAGKPSTRLQQGQGSAFSSLFTSPSACAQQGPSGTESSFLSMKKQLQPGTGPPSFASLGRNSTVILLGPLSPPSTSNKAWDWYGGALLCAWTPGSPIPSSHCRPSCSAIKSAVGCRPLVPQTCPPSSNQASGGDGRDGSGLTFGLPCRWSWRSPQFRALRMWESVLPM